MTSETTPVLGLQLTAAGQSMKHVTVNEALLKLDALVHLAVKERNRNTPPTAPVNGDRYLVGSAPTGIFAGHAGAIASFDVGTWTFLTPRSGWRAYVISETGLCVFDGTNWSGFSPNGTITEIQNLARLGLGTTADTTNPLAVKANNALFSAVSTPTGSGDLRLKLNKDAASNTLSQLYQTNYSGRAETGLIGNDRYAVKVSADGSTWKLALDIDSATGVVSAPQGLSGDRAAFRNRLINGNFMINQRVVASTVTLAAGAYGHDRWKAGSSGCTYSWTQSPNGDATLTITAGTLLQIIESTNITEALVHSLSWSGTSTGRCYQGAASGSYAAGPIQTASLAAGTQTIVEFATGTLTRVQFEVGAIVTAFERRPFTIELQLCQRYFCKTFPYATAPAQNAGFPGSLFTYAPTTNSGFGLFWRFPVQMRATPTCTGFNPNAANANWSNGGVAISFAGGINPSTDGAPVLTASTPTIAAGIISSAQATADAEL